MNKNLFINCPFDEHYKPQFDAILFSVYYCGCKPRCAKEIDNGGQIRLDKILSIIEQSDLGLHDISRTELNDNNLPRFNMPFELGLFLGARKFGGKRQKEKSCIIFDSHEYRYLEFISDISGQDIKSHNNDPEEIITKIRNWLNTFEELRPIPGAEAIIRQYKQYILQRLNLTVQDAQYSDNTQIIEQWIMLNRI